jgi:hypothetical protein
MPDDFDAAAAALLMVLDEYELAREPPHLVDQLRRMVREHEIVCDMRLRLLRREIHPDRPASPNRGRSPR